MLAVVFLLQDGWVLKKRHRYFESSSSWVGRALSLVLSAACGPRLQLSQWHTFKTASSQSHFPPNLFIMLQMGDELVCYSLPFLLVLVATRSATLASLLTLLLYVFMMMFRFAPVPLEQAGRVLRPRASLGGVLVVAHRGGSHDAPENTLAAIREVTHSNHFTMSLTLCECQDSSAFQRH